MHNYAFEYTGALQCALVIFVTSLMFCIYCINIRGYSKQYFLCASIIVVIHIYLECTGIAQLYYDRKVVSERLNEFTAIDTNKFDYTFSLILRAISFLSDGVDSQSILSLAIVILQLLLIPKISDRPFLSLVVWAGVIDYYNNTQLLKSGLALTFVMFAYLKMIEGKYKCALISYFASISVHAGTIIFIIPIFFAFFSRGIFFNFLPLTLICYVILFGPIGFSASFWDFFNGHSDKIDAYIYDANNGASSNFNMVRASNIILATVPILLYKYRKISLLPYWGIILSEVIFQFLAFSPTIGGRFYNFLSISPMLLNALPRHSINKNRINSLDIILLLYSGVRFSGVVLNGYFNQKY